MSESLQKPHNTGLRDYGCTVTGHVNYQQMSPEGRRAMRSIVSAAKRAMLDARRGMESNERNRKITLPESARK